MSDAFDDRRKALEEEFFKKQNDALLKKLNENAVKEHSREDISRLTGISNPNVLNTLADMKLGSAATLVMSMFPLVEVAWADGVLDDAERKVVLEQAASVGIKSGSEAAVFLARWLDERPEFAWHALWADYVGELSKKLASGDRELLKNEVLGRARLVAEASGGVLGLGFNVSPAEKRVLEKLERAFG